MSTIQTAVNTNLTRESFSAFDTNPRPFCSLAVEQVLNIIRNLSFDEVNSCVLAESEACVRLLLLAAHAKWSCLPQIAFDALSNLASEVSRPNYYAARL